MAEANTDQVVIAVLHAEKGEKANPGLTDAGKATIGAIQLPAGITSIVSGTGIRFLDTRDALLAQLRADIPQRFSPLLGSADSGAQAETGFEVVLADGKTVCPIGGYIGLIGTPGIDMWAFLQSLPAGTLLCTGRELLMALGYKDAKSGKMYCIDIVNKTVVEIS